MEKGKIITITINYDNSQSHKTFDLTWRDFFYKKRCNNLKEKNELNVGEQIKFARCKKKLSQADIITKLGKLDKSTFIAWEKNNRDIFLDDMFYDRIKELSKLLGLIFEYPYETKTFGGKLRKAFFDNGLTPFNVAKQFGYSDGAFIRKWLNNRSIPEGEYIHIFEKIEKLINIHFEYPYAVETFEDKIKKGLFDNRMNKKDLSIALNVSETQIIYWLAPTQKARPDEEQIIQIEKILKIKLREE